MPTSQLLPDASKFPYSAEQQRGVTVRTFPLNIPIVTDLYTDISPRLVHLSRRGDCVTVDYRCRSLIFEEFNSGLTSIATKVSAFINRTSRDKHLFVRNHLSAYFISLLLCNLVQGEVFSLGKDLI